MSEIHNFREVLPKELTFQINIALFFSVLREIYFSSWLINQAGAFKDPPFLRSDIEEALRRCGIWDDKFEEAIGFLKKKGYLMHMADNYFVGAQHQSKVFR